MNNTPSTQSALETQVGGAPYKSFAIQPAEFCQRNRLGWLEGNVIKYVVRHKAKNGREDILKAMHYLQLLLEMEYPADAAELVQPAQPQWIELHEGDVKPEGYEALKRGAPDAGWYLGGYAGSVITALDIESYRFRVPAPQPR